MTDLRINEKFEAACPELSKDEFDKLEALILKDGVIYNPILVWDGVIVDGHNRHFIAKKHNLSFETKEMTFESDDDAIAWIKENAISRRNLNDYQRSKLVLELEEYYKAKAKERQLSGLKNQNVVTPILAERDRGEVRNQLASKAGVSHGTLDKVKYIEYNADDEIKEDLERGDISISKAYNELKIPESKINPDVDILEKAASSLENWINKYRYSDSLHEFCESVGMIVRKIRDKKASYGL